MARTPPCITLSECLAGIVLQETLFSRTYVSGSAWATLKPILAFPPCRSRVLICFCSLGHGLNLSSRCKEVRFRQFSHGAHP